jgi:membrane protein
MSQSMKSSSVETAVPAAWLATAAVWTVLGGMILMRFLRGGGAGPRQGKGEPDRASGEKDHASPAVAAESGRGREAQAPSSIPARGWKDVLWRVYEEIGQDRLTSVAAGVTYYALLALFPAIAALVSIYGLFADPLTIQEHLESLSGLLPGGALDVIRDQVTRIAGQGQATLGLSFVIGLVISLWSANAAMKAIFDALNIVYDEDEKRGFVALNLQSLGFTLGAILFVLLAIGGIVVLPIMLDFIGLGTQVEWLLTLARWPALLAIIILALSVLYRYGPSRDRAEWKWVTPGSLAASLIWLAVSMLFSWYVTNFGSYNETYGSLGAIIGFMTWIWISSVVVLLGAEINAEVEHQTAHDTTEGAAQPLGARGARMADTLGTAKA